MLLMSSAAYPIAKAAAAAARAAGVPAIVTRHGEVGTRELPTVALEDADSVDWVLCWGEREAEWTRQSTRAGTRAVVTGSPAAEAQVDAAPSRRRLRRRLRVPLEQPLILFVPTNLSRNGWYASRRTATDSVQFAHVCGVLDALLAVPGFQVVVKEHPLMRDSPIETWLAGRARVVRARPFSHYVHLAEATVIDTPSTAFVQALRGSSRLYLLGNPVTQWVPGVPDHLESHGIAVCDGPQVADRIRADADAGLLSRPTLYPDAAIEPYLAGPHGAAAATSRAVAAVKAIAAGEPRIHGE